MSGPKARSTARRTGAAPSKAALEAAAVIKRCRPITAARAVGDAATRMIRPTNLAAAAAAVEKTAGEKALTT
eukprot:3820206-Prymnesium_polylepis.1